MDQGIFASACCQLLLSHIDKERVQVINLMYQVPIMILYPIRVKFQVVSLPVGWWFGNWRQDWLALVDEVTVEEDLGLCQGITCFLLRYQYIIEEIKVDVLLIFNFKLVDVNLQELLLEILIGILIQYNRLPIDNTRHFRLLTLIDLLKNHNVLFALIFLLWDDWRLLDYRLSYELFFWRVRSHH